MRTEERRLDLGRILEKSHSTVIRWEKRVANIASAWSPPAPSGIEVTVEGDELYTRVGRNFSDKSQGWTISFVERASRCWLVAQAGHKDVQLFSQGTQAAWQLNNVILCVGLQMETRYSQQLWLLQYWEQVLQNLWISKVWREGLEVAMKIKGSQGRKRVKWVKPEHPYTAISPKQEVGANHNEALNSSIRRRCSACRRTNTYAKR